MGEGRRRRWSAIASAAAFGLALALGLAGCGPGDSGDGRPSIAVTTVVLGAVVRDLVGDAADVEVVMPNGADPHEFQPSAKDVAKMDSADLLVKSGLGLEEGLKGAIHTAEEDGVPTFTATDHIAVRRIGAGEISDDGPLDPHFWLDPIAMRDVVHALVPVLRDRLGIDVAARGRALERRLGALDRTVRDELSAIPPERRLLVTGHESMGYFADRYGFRIVGALIPSLSSQAEASAETLARLKEQIEETGAPAVFTEPGTPSGLASAIADETGARVVEIDTHRLPDDGSYATMLTGIARSIAGTLAPANAPAATSPG
jgi:zinc/manganese transport system substrate-binding protein